MTVVLLAHRIEETIPRQVGPYERNTITLEEFDAVVSDSRFQFSVHPDRLFESREPGGVLLTLDDGYAVDVHRWLPLIEKHELYTIIFITTGFVDGTAAPYEETLGRLLSMRDRFKPSVSDVSVDVGDFEGKQAQYETMRLRLFDLPTEERIARLAELARINGVALPPVKPGNFLNWQEIVELDQHPLISIGAHTVTHPSLTRIPRTDARVEVASSKRRLEEILGHDVAFFSYPYGANNRITRRIVKQAGFRLGFGTKRGSVRKFTSQRQVPRIDIKTFVANTVPGCLA